MVSLRREEISSYNCNPVVFDLKLYIEILLGFFLPEPLCASLIMNN